jgi:hypothetical protein
LQHADYTLLEISCKRGVMRNNLFGSPSPEGSSLDLLAACLLAAVREFYLITLEAAAHLASADFWFLSCCSHLLRLKRTPYHCHNGFLWPQIPLPVQLPWWRVFGAEKGDVYEVARTVYDLYKQPKPTYQSVGDDDPCQFVEHVEEVRSVREWNKSF